MHSPSATPSDAAGTETALGVVDPLGRILTVVAIDGPSGSGKSTVAREVARRLGAAYLDTGAMYRAITWAVLAAGIPVDDAEQVAALARTVEMEVGIDPASPGVRVAGVPVDGVIRGPDVTAAVSAVSAVPAVRQLLVSRQRAVVQVAIEEALTESVDGWTGAVVEGRDIGTVVLPHAPVKIFLTAQPGARAERRAAEQAVEGFASATGQEVATTKADLARRDYLDSSRPVSPLHPAADALTLDSTQLSAAEVVEIILQACRVAGINVPNDGVEDHADVPEHRS